MYYSFFLRKRFILHKKKSTCVARQGKALTTDPVVMRSSPATGHIRCALLANLLNPIICD